MSLFNVGAYKASKNAVTGKNKVLAYPDGTVGAAGRWRLGLSYFGLALLRWPPSHVTNDGLHQLTSGAYLFRAPASLFKLHEVVWRHLLLS